MQRRHVSSGSPHEQRFGCARALRVGPHVFVAGSAPIEPDGSVTPGGSVAVAGLVYPAMLVEIEADALILDEGQSG